MASRASSRAVPWLVHGALILATALLCRTLYLQLGNTLHDNGRWESTKVGLGYGILGAVSYLTTRTATHLNHLDLSAWHGFQEVLYREPVRLAALEVRVRLGEPGYVVAIFDHTGETFSGVRLSTNPDHPSACLHGTAAGEFLRRTPLDAGALGTEWHRLVVSRAGDGYDVTLDGRVLGRCAPVPLRPARVGFRGSRAMKMDVDDVVVRSPDGVVLEEDFANHRHAWAALGLALAGVLAVHAGVLAASARRRRRDGLPAGPYLFTTHFVLLFCLVAALAVDDLIQWRRHPDDVDFRGYETTIESKTDIFYRLRTQYARPKPPGVHRILVLGGSQTWGSGARSREDTWHQRLEALLDADAPPGVRYQVISGGIPAFVAAQMYKLYTEDWIHLEPDTVVLNMGHNDKDVAAFELSLRRFLDLNGERGIRTVFVPEANCVEWRDTLHELYERHAVMRRLAAERGVPLIEVHGPLVERQDQGFLWWDRVHLTPFGHRLLAERIYAERDVLLGPATRALR